MKENKVISPEIKAVIAAALARYLMDEKLSFRIISIKPVQISQINFWGLEGRLNNMKKRGRRLETR